MFNLGYIELEIGGLNLEKLLNILREKKISIKCIERKEFNKFCIKIPYSNYKKLLEETAKLCYNISVKKIIGFSLIVVLVCLFVWRVSAQTQTAEEEPTIVIGEAQNIDGSENMFVVAQPNNSENPLGNPIGNIEENTDNKSVNMESIQSVENNKKQITQPQNVEQAGKDFENTLLEANGRVYDVQSYPEGDLPIMGNSANPDTIYSPNVNP